MTPLALSGTAKSVSGATVHGRHLLRLRDAISGPVCEADAAIVRDDADLYLAREHGFDTAVVFDACSASDFAGLDIRVRLDDRFGYLAAGDVIAFDPGSRRFRVLFRRASKHNSFLVTERCNHYCLMCSQPPRNVKDGWIIDEIASCIDLIDPATESVGFTGGEPLLERDRFLAVLRKMRDRLPRDGSPRPDEWARLRRGRYRDRLGRDPASEPLGRYTNLRGGRSYPRLRRASPRCFRRDRARHTQDEG